MFGRRGDTRPPLSSLRFLLLLLSSFLLLPRFNLAFAYTDYLNGLTLLVVVPSPSMADSYFQALDSLKQVCEQHGLTMAEATFRWMLHHSMLSGGHGDGVIIGASTIQHLSDNLRYCGGGRDGDNGNDNDNRLPQSVLEGMERAWQLTRPDCPSYFRTA